MNRRNFLRNSSLAGFTFSTGFNNLQHLDNGNQLHVHDDTFSLNELTIDELQQKMQRGNLTSATITNLYLQRIKTIDKSGPRLNAVIETNPDALKIAQSLDMERKAGKVRGPLHGIPVLVKDNINTGDLMMTTAGSLALNGHRSAKDAFIIQKLREAGAVLLGKTNLSEWANFRASRSTSGWSSRGGQTRCPYILDRNPSGSSSGSGVATAANLCAISIGTETNGSIIAPSSVNGLVSIKPTVGLWSRSGIIPISVTQDTAGPMARTVKDAAILLGLLSAADPGDPATKDASYRDYTKFLDANGLNGKRIGIEKTQLEGTSRVTSLLKMAVDDLKKLGATIVEVEIRKSMTEPQSAQFTLLKYEFTDGLNRYLAASTSAMKSLKDIIDFNEKNESKVMPYFKQETLIASLEKNSLDSAEYKDAVAKVLSSRKILTDLMAQHKLDALSAISNGPAGCIDLINGDYNTGFSSYGSAAMAGFPNITVPMGQVSNLPVGISFFSAANKEPELISMAYAYEQKTKHRKPPTFLATFPIK